MGNIAAIDAGNNALRLVIAKKSGLFEDVFGVKVTGQ
jgi:exopolyphosphatase/pppGpp-phosphohydrolase